MRSFSNMPLLAAGWSRRAVKYADTDLVLPPSRVNTIEWSVRLNLGISLTTGVLEGVMEVGVVVAVPFGGVSTIGDMFGSPLVKSRTFSWVGVPSSASTRCSIVNVLSLWLCFALHSE